MVASGPVFGNVKTSEGIASRKVLVSSRKGSRKGVRKLEFLKRVGLLVFETRRVWSCEGTI